MESKEDRFKRLAEKRVNELLDKLRLVGNLADRRNYSYTQDQAKQIIQVIEDHSKSLRAKFLDQEFKEKAFTFKPKSKTK